MKNYSKLVAKWLKTFEDGQRKATLERPLRPIAKRPEGTKSN